MKIVECGHPPGMPEAKMYTMNGCAIFIAVENGKWHLSISHKNRYPSWDEIKRVRYQLMPRDKDVVMALPPEDQYVNIHPNCFHLWEN